jgi:hypothetical protein
MPDDKDLGLEQEQDAVTMMVVRPKGLELLSEEPVAPVPTPAPARAAASPDKAFRASLQRFEEEYEAKASLLEELIDMALPEAKQVARSIRSEAAESDPEQVKKLEALLGNLTEKARATEWLDTPALRLDGTLVPPEPQGVGAGDSGALVGHETWLLMDGRLVVVDMLCTWAMEGERLRESTTVIQAREVKRTDVVRDCNLVKVLTVLRKCLYLDQEAQAPELAERRERFDSLVRDLTRAMTKHNVQLRRVGDSPA